MTPTTLARYRAAHRNHYERNFPAVIAGGFYPDPIIPDTRKAGGLQRFIVNFLDWSGHYGNRINTTGRKIYSAKQNKEIWIKGTTKTGTGDTQGIINGLHCTFEVKIGGDTPSARQMLQQQRIEAAGGRYFFVRTPEDFLSAYDDVIHIRG